LSYWIFLIGQTLQNETFFFTTLCGLDMLISDLEFLLGCSRFSF
jgi:hypothetical protein